MEILIVVVVIGILAAIVIPQFANATQDAKAASTTVNLRRIRTQLELYKAEHGGTSPALATFEDQMLLSSNMFGQTAAIGTAGYTLGPYMKTMPVNPMTGGRTISAGAVGSSDWYYDESSGVFYANDSVTSRAY